MKNRWLIPILLLATLGSVQAAESRARLKSAADYAKRASAEFDASQMEAALDDFTEAIRLAPRSHAYYLRRAAFCGLVADTEVNKRSPDSKKLAHFRQLALADASRACQLDPKNWRCYLLRGNCYRKIDSHKAILDFTQVIQLHPKGWVAYASRAEAYRSLGRVKLAQADEGMVAKLRARQL